MKVKMLIIFLLLFASFTNLRQVAAADKPQPQSIAEKASCGVCGMYPARYPQWQTQIIFNDGTMVPFDGAKDMFKYLLNMVEYNKQRQRAEVAAIWVRDYADGGWLDGEAAFYVVGSTVMGPMGQELVPFATTEAAQKFQGNNGGTVSRF
ncbi:MAG TPA: nitrous oxide reductase accessory protein NosL, partial [Desulfurivibrionaceae bacterium]|nr:nitrous oxide reductase accessory protein NosL [Desulfurivibrionaceae bacterium]